MHEPDAGWRPLLDGELAERALTAASDVARALRDPPQASVPGEHSGDLGLRIDEVSLARGRAGYAVLFDYLAEAGLGAENGDVSARFLNEAIDLVSETEMSPSLYMGFTGVAWAAALLSDDPVAATEDPNEEIDAVLRDFVGTSPWRGDYDLITGLVGIGVYALQRFPRDSARSALNEIVKRLSETSQETSHGTTWFSPPESLPADTRAEYRDGYYNLGLSHGVPGVAAFLGAVCAIGLGERAQAMLEGTVDWILAQRLPPGSDSAFPAVSADSLEPKPARSAWCYGDPGIALALLLAARGARKKEWERLALDVALKAARRPPEQAGVIDVSLCHGSAGLGHMFNRLFQATGEEELGRAAVFWFERTLQLREGSGGVAGFFTWAGNRDDQGRMIEHPGLLSGAAGVALALVAATSPVEPVWDRILLASSPQLP